MFGHGPDTFGVITVQNFWDDMLNTTSQKYENVHNELQYLVTIGAVGLTAYRHSLEPLLAKLSKGLKKPVVMAMAFAAICYCGTQAVVNISGQWVTPIMLLMIMMGDGDYEKKMNNVLLANIGNS